MAPSKAHLAQLGRHRRRHRRPAARRPASAEAPATTIRASTSGRRCTSSPASTCPKSTASGPTTRSACSSEIGTDMTRWPTEKHFTSWLTLAPQNKVSGGRLLSSRTPPSANRAAAIFRLAAMTLGRTQTALGAFYRRLAFRIGKAKAVTATARKLAILVYRTLKDRLVYVDPGAAAYDAHIAPSRPPAPATRRPSRIRTRRPLDRRGRRGISFLGAGPYARWRIPGNGARSAFTPDLPSSLLTPRTGRRPEARPGEPAHGLRSDDGVAGAERLIK